jgi:hypothetical protein
MRSVTLVGAHPRCRRLVHRLRLAASALVLTIIISPPRARALDLDLQGADGLNTETIANRERLKVWDDAERYGANTVSNMERRYVSPDGMRMGNYAVIPNVGAAVVFDDNIFAIDADKQSDVRSELTPSVQFKSQLPRHVLDFSLDGKIVNYAEHTDQDYANYRAKVDTALHFDSAHTLSASFSTLLKHEERDDPLADFTAREPIPVYEHRAAIGITRDVGRLYGTLAASAERRDYGDVLSIYGAPLDEDTRDTDTYSTQAKVGYRFSPGFEFITKMKVSKSDNRGNAFGNRDSWGYEAVAGLAFETNPLLRWRILGGYGTRDYTDAKLTDIATSLVEAEVEWLPTQRLTIYATLSRQIEEALDLNATGVVQSGAKLKADYEIYHNLVLSGALELRNDNFLGTSRQDDVFMARAGLDYYFTKNWLFTFGYEHQVRDSTDDSLDMHRNRFMVGAKLRF